MLRVHSNHKPRRLVTVQGPAMSNLWTALAVISCACVLPLLLPLALLLAPVFLSAVAALLIWRLICQHGGDQLAQTYQHSVAERIVPLSYPALPASEGSSPPNSPRPAGQPQLTRGTAARGAATNAGQSKPGQPTEPSKQQAHAAQDKPPVRLPATAQAFPSAAGIAEISSVINDVRKSAGSTAPPAATGGASILARLRLVFQQVPARAMKAFSEKGHASMTKQDMQAVL